MSFVALGKAAVALPVGIASGTVINSVGSAVHPIGHLVKTDLHCDTLEAITTTFLTKYALEGIDYFFPEGSLAITALKAGLVGTTIFNNASCGAHAPCPHDHRYCKQAVTAGINYGYMTALALAITKGAVPALIGGGLVGFGVSFLTVKLCQRMFG